MRITRGQLIAAALSWLLIGAVALVCAAESGLEWDAPTTRASFFPPPFRAVRAFRGSIFP